MRGGERRWTQVQRWPPACQFDLPVAPGSQLSPTAQFTMPSATSVLLACTWAAAAAAGAAGAFPGELGSSERPCLTVLDAAGGMLSPSCPRLTGATSSLCRWESTAGRRSRSAGVSCPGLELGQPQRQPHPAGRRRRRRHAAVARQRSHRAGTADGRWQQRCAGST